MLAAIVSGCATFVSRPLPSASEMVPADLPTIATSPNDHPRLAARVVDTARPLDEWDVARLALAGNPDLAAQRLQVGIATAQAFSDGLLPDPQLGLSIDHPADPGLVNALTASLGMDLSWLLTHRATRDSGAHHAQAVRWDVAWSEWLVINQVRTLCRRIGYLDRQVALAQGATASARRIYDASDANRRRGDAKLDETTLYQVAFIDAQDRLLGLERTAAAARFQLNALVGVAPDTVLVLAPAPLVAVPDSGTVATLTGTAVLRRLDLAALQEGYLSQEAQGRRAAVAALPLPQLDINRARDTSAVYTKGLSLAVGLPLWNRGRGEVRIAAAMRDQMRAEYIARVAQARNDIAALLGDMRAVQAQRLALVKEIPALETAAGVMSEAAQRGDITLVSYETVRASLLDKELAVCALEQAESEAHVALETALGDRLGADDIRGKTND
jgi:outer membrane protein, heavy metal efflux system